MPTNRQFLIDHLPTSKLTPDVFRLSEGAMPAPGEGEVLVRTRYVSLDAANRAWMWGATYRAALKAGDVMAGGALAEVVESRAPGFAPGDLVWADTGWQDYAALNAKHVDEARQGARRPAAHLPDERLWRRRSHRLFRPARLRTADARAKPLSSPPPPDRSARSSARSRRSRAAASSASRAAQTSAPCSPANSASTPPSTTRRRNFSKALRAAVPKGIDVYFDNVGGNVLEACLFNMNNNGRIACCGAVSQYDAPSAHGPRGVPGLIVTKRLTMRGFIVMDYEDQNAKALADLQGWVASGQLKVREDIVDGFEQPPQRPHRPPRRRQYRQADGEGELTRYCGEGAGAGSPTATPSSRGSAPPTSPFGVTRIACVPL